MAAQQRLPPKKQVALALLEQASVYVHLDPRSEGVHVPPWFKKQPQLVLQIGLNMAVPIHDLNVNDDGITCTLSFNRSPHFCRLPWRSVFALVGEAGRGMVWPEDVPAEVVAQAEAQKARAAVKEEPKLYAVQTGGETAAGGTVERSAGGGRREHDERSAGGGRHEHEDPAGGAEQRPRKPRKPRVKRVATKRVERSAEGGRRDSVERSAEGGRREHDAPRPAGRAKPKPAAAEAKPAATESKPKRALPPYLRVIK